MTFLLFFAGAFVLIVFLRIIIAGLRAIGSSIFNQIIHRWELQDARLELLDRIAGTPTPPRRPMTTEDRAALQLARAARRDRRRADR